MAARWSVRAAGGGVLLPSTSRHTLNNVVFLIQVEAKEIEILFMRKIESKLGPNPEDVTAEGIYLFSNDP